MPKAKAAPKPPPPQTPEQYVRENYGFLAGFLNVKELHDILIWAAQHKATVSAIQGKVYATKWWKTTAEVTRNWIALQNTDPATARQRLAATKTQIKQAAAQAGIPINDKQLNTWAVNVNKFGWTEQQIQQGIGAQFHYNPEKAATGQVQLTVDALKQKASDYLVPLSNNTIQKWARDVVGGNVDLSAFDSYAKEQAKSMFPGLSAALDSGVTVAQYVEPYKEHAASLLEIDPEQVNFMDSKWRKAVDQIDPKTGIRASMSLSDWDTELRTNSTYGYDKTQQAQAQAADLTTKLTSLFGH